MLLDVIKEHTTEKEYNLLISLFTEGLTEDELACNQISCGHRTDCDISKYPKEYINIQGNIGKRDYQTTCHQYNNLNRQTTIIKRLKKQVLEKLKKLKK